MTPVCHRRAALHAWQFGQCWDMAPAPPAACGSLSAGRAMLWPLEGLRTCAARTTSCWTGCVVAFAALQQRFRDGIPYQVKCSGLLPSSRPFLTFVLIHMMTVTRGRRCCRHARGSRDVACSRHWCRCTANWHGVGISPRQNATSSGRSSRSSCCRIQMSPRNNLWTCTKSKKVSMPIWDFLSAWTCKASAGGEATDWAISPERVNDDGGYTISNLVLVVREVALRSILLWQECAKTSF